APSSTLLIQEGNIEQLHVETENTKLDLEVKKQQDTDTPNLSDQK
ncbi:permease domain protein, partial [Acinetobacter baumannii 45057_1]